MSWKKTAIKDEKIMFIGDWLKQEFSFTELCHRYAISRPTGYKLVERYIQEGEAAVEERSHARHSHPNATTPDTIRLLLDLKSRYLSWGPLKIKDQFQKIYPEAPCPAASTIGDILKKHGLVKSRKHRRKVPSYLHPFAHCDQPNRVWSADFKGQFRLKDQSYLYPLTLSDNFSRFLLLCQGLSSPNGQSTLMWFTRAFEEYGLPDVIRTDNGYPFAGTAVGGLSALSVWWLKLGIMPERIAKGRPDQNGRHERMHRTLKEATIHHPKTKKQQQEAFDQFKDEYNFERPHQALGMKTPGECYEKSINPFPSQIPEIVYPDDYLIRKVRTNGEVKWHGKQYFVSELLRGEPIGLELIDEQRAIVYFSKLKLGIIDARKSRMTRPI